jgi:hypothetical protein
VVKDPLCPCCKQEEETIIHVFWTCPAAVDVWGSGPKIFQKSYAWGNSFMEIMTDFFTWFTAEEMELLAVLARRIWLRRNTFFFDGIFTLPNRVVELAFEAHQEFKLCNQKTQLIVGDMAPSAVRMWKLSPVGVVKVNWDAAVNKNEGCLRIGIVAHDCEGVLLGAKCVFCLINADPTVAESLAAIYAMIFCKEVGFFDVIFEGDALQVVKEIQSTPPYTSRFGHFVGSIL